MQDSFEMQMKAGNKRLNTGSPPSSSGPFKHPRLLGGDASSNRIASKNELPIASAKERLIEEIRRKPSSILVGETGSGKTTQVPQYIFNAGLSQKGAIAVTQPRRVAAISIAKRVAWEMESELGTLVGYKVRFEDATSAESKIVFLTDGMLLREAMLDPLLRRYSWILLDEAHERTINTDILFGVVKRAQEERFQKSLSRLQIVVMSATLDADKFSEYLKKAPKLYIQGRTHPIWIRHAQEPQEDWHTATLRTIFQIHHEAPERQDILVFLTGQEDIETMSRQIKEATKADNENHIKLLPICLYAAQTPGVQQKVFVPTKSGCRKVILSTNIAETSLTIPGVRYVVDSGRVKAKVHQPSTGMDMLKMVKVSKAQALQRTGRAGRESEGHCYRIYTKTEFDNMVDNTVPEILRCNLGSVLLQMLSIGIDDVENFDFLEKPPKDAVDGAFRQLKLLGAVDHDGKLTDLGRKMAPFPLDPKFTKMIFSSESLQCTEPVITIVALLSSETILVTPPTKREEAYAARRKFQSSEGDLITIYKLYKAFKKAANQIEWCQHHFVHLRHIKFADEIRSQLLKLCENQGIAMTGSSNHSETYENVRQAIAQGMFTNVARLNREGHYVTLDSRLKVKIHPSSVMFQTKPELIVFTEMILTQKPYIRDLTLVDARWLLEAQPDYFRQHRLVFEN